MSKIRLTIGMMEEDIKKIFPTGINTKPIELKQNNPIQSKETSNKLKLWDDYTSEELIQLRKNEKAIYISLYMVKYGFPPQNI